MSQPARPDSFEISVKLKSHPSLDSLADAARERIFKKLGIKTISYGDAATRGAKNPLDVVDRFNARLRTILSKCEQFAVKGSLTLIVSINGGYTRKTAQLDILNALFLECQEAKLARVAQDVIDDLKEFKRKANLIARAEREKKIIEDGLQKILHHLSRSEYCEIHPGFDKEKGTFDVHFIDKGSVYPDPLKEEEYLWDPSDAKATIRMYLQSVLNSGFPMEFYYHQWSIYEDDPEDFKNAEIEFQNLLAVEEIDESDVRYGQELIRQRKEAYQRAIRAAGGAMSFAATFFFDHVVNKALYAIPGVGTAMMVYDLAQLASEVPDGVRAFSEVLDLIDEET